MANPVMRMDTGAVINRAAMIDEIAADIDNYMKQVDAITDRVKMATKGAFSLAYSSSTEEVNVEMTKHGKKVGTIAELTRDAVASKKAVDEAAASTVRIQRV